MSSSSSSVRVGCDQRDGWGGGDCVSDFYESGHAAPLGPAHPPKLPEVAGEPEVGKTLKTLKTLKSSNGVLRMAQELTRAPSPSGTSDNDVDDDDDDNDDDDDDDDVCFQRFGFQNKFSSMWSFVFNIMVGNVRGIEVYLHLKVINSSTFYHHHHHRRRHNHHDIIMMTSSSS